MSVKAEVNLEIGKKREIEPDQEVIEKEGFFFLFLVIFSIRIVLLSVLHFGFCCLNDYVI